MLSFLLSLFLMADMTVPPLYLYKILSLENWKASSQTQTLQLPKEDSPFIHLATEEQVDKIIEKFWSDVPEFVILKIETSKLSGQLVFETNPGGTNKYYHLYNGYIPINSVVEYKIIKNSRFR